MHHQPNGNKRTNNNTEDVDVCPLTSRLELDETEVARDDDDERPKSAAAGAASERAASTSRERARNTDNVEAVSPARGCG